MQSREQKAYYLAFVQLLTSHTCLLPCVVWVKRRDSVCHSHSAPTSLACSQARPFQQLTVLAMYDRCDKQKHSKDGGYDKLCGTPHFARPAEHLYEHSYRDEVLRRTWSAEPTC